MSAVDGRRFDVIVLGSHLTTGLLGAVLAKHGVSVLLLDAPGDRTEPSGDSTVPYTTAVFQLLAERFDIPEIAAFAHFTDLPAEVRRTSGIKKSLTFLHHSRGARHQPGHTVQFNVPGEHNEWHLFRRSVDEHARAVAKQYGVAEAAGRPEVIRLELDDTGVSVYTADGRFFTGAFLIDASGTELPGSPFRLVDAGDRLQLRSRMLTTTMRGVRPFEEVVDTGKYGRVTPMSLGTVHHLFDRGWIQVVGFGNHDEAIGDLCNITVGIDSGVVLPNDPAAAFAGLIAEFPDIAAQFAKAESTGQWSDHAPIQRLADATCGPQWFALERSAYRTDEFLSRDVTMAAELINALAPAVLAAVRAPESAEKFLRPIAEFQRGLVEFNDRMLAAARVAAVDFRLWNAYSRVWLLWQIIAHLSLKRATAEAAEEDWSPVERFDLGPIWFTVPDGLRQLLDGFFAKFDRVRSGRLAPDEAAEQIFRSLRVARFVPPLYAFGDPGARYYHFTFLRRLRMLAWVWTAAPADFKRLLAVENVTGRRGT